MYNIKEAKRDNKRLEQVVHKWVQELFPIEASDKKLEVNDVKIEYNPNDVLDPNRVKESIIHGKSIVANVYLTATLYKNNRQIDHKTIKIGVLPLKTPARTFVLDGVQYDTTNMIRLRSGVYTEEKANGEIETRINLKRGYNMKLKLDPQKKVILADLSGAVFPLYAILHHLGVSDEEMQNAWGSELFQINKNAVTNTERIFLKFANRYLSKTFDNIDQARSELSDRLNDTRIDPETTKVTLGQSFDKMDTSLLIRASQRLIEVMKNPKTQDNKDDIYFMQSYDLPMMLEDDYLLKRQNLNKMRFYLVNRMKNKDKIRDIIPLNFLSKYTLPIINGSSFSNPIDYTNPLGMVAKQFEYTKKGEGGIQSRHAVTHESMDLYHSHAGFIDPVFTPDQNPGIVVRTAINVKQDGTTLKKRLYNVKTHQFEWVPNDKIHEYKVAFGGYYDIKNNQWTVPKVRALYKGKIKYYPTDQIDYVMETDGDIFNLVTLGIPFVNSDQSNRAAMGAKMQTQAIPLKNPERPLVTSIHPITKKPIDTEVSKRFLPTAQEDGVVESVTDKYMTIRYNSGKREKLPFYKDYPIGTNVVFTTTSRFKPGDKIKKDDILMESNFTRGGDLLLGTNLHVAYMPWKSLNSEDGIVITESAAKKLASEHIYNIDIPKKGYVFDINKFKAAAMGKYSLQAYEHLDDKGIVKKGTVLKPGDPYALYLKPKTVSEEEKLLGRIDKNLIKPYIEKSALWEKNVEGQVIDVVDTGDTYHIVVKTVEPAKRGDKLTGRHGNKGVITAVIPDEQAPTTPDGKRVEAILSPTFIPKRINVGQILETTSGKVADKTKKYIPYLYTSKMNNYTFVKGLSDKTGLKDKEYLIVDGKKTKNPVLTGKQYMLKLKYTEDKGFSVRGYTGPMNFDLTPASGGKEGGKSIDRLTLNALMVHGANKILTDVGTYKAEDNPEFWRAFMTGNPLPKPKSTMAYKTMMAYLKGAGVNPVQTGEQIRLMPMTDKEVLKMSNGEIKEPKLVLGKNLEPERKGLFDPYITGGTRGDKWAHIELPVAIPNPIYSHAIKQVLGLSNKEYEGYLSGELTYKGKKGPEAIKKMLQNLDIDKELKRLRKEAKNTDDFAKLNKLNRSIRFLKNLKQSGLKPTDLMMKYVPVVPPKMRPLLLDTDGGVTSSDLNNIYKEILMTKNNIEDMKKKGVARSKILQAQKHLVKEVERLSGVMAPSDRAKYNPRKAADRGFLDILAGDTPKTGYIQKKVIAKRQNLSGLAVVAVDPSLDIDELGIPEKMAFKLYEPMITRELVKQGYSKFAAQKEIEQKTEKARTILQNIMKDRYILMNRAPSLHKYSILAFKPRLVKGKSVKVPLMVVKGFNMDFDGDKAMIHVPVTNAANQEAEKMLPSRNIIHPSADKIMNKPVWEDAVGLYALTKEGKKTKKKYKTYTDALQDYRAGKLDETDVITVGKKKTTIGRLMVSNILPGDLEVNTTLNKKAMDSIIRKIAKKNPDLAAKTLSDLKRLGDNYITYYGMSLGLHDIRPMPDVRNKLLPTLKKPEDAAKVIKGIEKEVSKKLKDSFYDMANKAGVNVKWSQVAQMSVTPVMIKGLRGDIPAVITRSYVEGLPSDQYWISSFGGRRGVVSKTVETAEPGAFSKELAAGLMDMVVTEKDCGTTDGIEVEVGSGKELRRYPVSDIRKNGKLVVSKDEFITPEKVKELQKAHIKIVKVRSPLTCKASKGVCVKCFGAYMDDSLPKLGDHVGALSATTLGEPLTQMAMRVFHTGSTAGSNVGAIGALDRIKQVTQIPKTIPNRAVVVKNNGYVDKIEKSPVGGWDVHIGEEIYHVPPTQDLTVKKGQQVKKGDVISNGQIHPYDIFITKGPKEAGRYVAEELTDLYHGTGVPVSPAVPEMVAKSMLRYGQVLDPKDSPFEPGDVVEIGSLERFGDKIVEVDIRDAVGFKLAEPTGGLPKNHKLTQQDAKNLLMKSIYKVKVFSEKPVYKPLMIGINRSPLYNEDWMLKTGFREIKTNIIDAAAKGAVSYVGGPHSSVLTRYMYGPTVGISPFQKTAELAIKPAEKQRRKYPYMGTTEIYGLKIDIENMPGTYRGPYKMYNAYGEIRGTIGADGEPIDVFIGDNLKSRKVYIVHQKKRNKMEYDEDKVMLGFNSLEEAKKIYLKHYDTTKYFYSIEEMDIEKFKKIYLRMRKP